MSWFNRRKKSIDAPREELIVQPPASSRVEVELHKGANQDAVVKAKQANEHLKELLVNNGFTLKIYLAAGGHPPKNRKA